MALAFVNQVPTPWPLWYGAALSPSWSEGLAAVVALAFLAIWLLIAQNVTLRSKARAAERKAQKARAWRAERDLSDYDNQIDFVAKVPINPVTRVMNREMYGAVYAPLERKLADLSRHQGQTYRILCETSLGAFLRTPPKIKRPRTRQDYIDNEMRDLAFKSFNSKRLDVLVISASGAPKLAIEYQGTGHQLDASYEKRDAVKRLALEKANIPFLEVFAATPRAEFLQQVEQILRK